MFYDEFACRGRVARCREGASCGALSFGRDGLTCREGVHSWWTGSTHFEKLRGARDALGISKGFDGKKP